MKRLKPLINVVPLGAIALLIGAMIWQQAQRQQSVRLDYDNPIPSPSTHLSPELGQSKTAEVIDVHDGDTIKVSLNGRQERIRFCGINAPELAQPGGTASRDHLRALITAADNRVMFMETDKDRYGRTVAEVFLPASQPGDEETFLNYEQVKSGDAYVYTQYVKSCPNGWALPQGEAEAKQARAGVWADSQATKPWDYRRANR